jgi:hypothetical protein
MMSIGKTSFRGGDLSALRNVARESAFAFAMVLVSIAGLSGCSPDDPLQRRQAEFRYTTDSLVEELIPRLKRVNESSARRAGGPSDLAREVAEREAGRGGDGNRADPNTVDAIVADVVGKLSGLAVAESEPPAAEQVLDKLAQSNEVPQDVLQEFATKLRAAQGTAPR